MCEVRFISLIVDNGLTVGSGPLVELFETRLSGEVEIISLDLVWVVAVLSPAIY